eukprot:gene5354-9162_t
MGQSTSSVLELMLEPENIETARGNFKKYDGDNNGKIDREEFTKFFSDLFDAFENHWTEKDTKENSAVFKTLSNFDNYDKDKNGDISFDEFVQTLKENQFSL